MRLFPGRRYQSGWRWCFWRWTDVDPVGKGDIYLTRLHLFQTPWFSMMLHWLRLPDPQPDLHDHPNDFLSLLVWGSYREEVPTSDQPENLEVRKVRFFNIVRAEDRHRLVEVSNPTITLVVANKVRRDWGFWVDGEFVPWRTYDRIEEVPTLEHNT